LKGNIMAKNKFYLECPYDEKDDAKELGAWWDGNKKKWYVPAGMDEGPFERWFPATARKANSKAENETGLRFSEYPYA
jgi:hypothetical protein